jgi:hypothetical protein
MSTPRKHSRAACKARGALAARTGLNTANACASPYGGPPTPMAHGHPRLPKERPEMFSARRAQHAYDQEACPAQ